MAAKARPAGLIAGTLKIRLKIPAYLPGFTIFSKTTTFSIDMPIPPQYIVAFLFSDRAATWK
jgi:hypothetical protein